MNTYILLANWTEQGIKSIKDSPARLDAARQALRAIGGEMVSFHMTMGEFDFVVVYTAPDDAAAARFTLQVAKGGNLRSRTLKAFPEAQYRDIVAALS